MNQSKSNLVSSAEQILGYHFRKPSLLVHALTHDSYSNGTISNYERLEFIGDAALSLAMANYLNETYPKLKLGDISMLRSANVCNEKLARAAVRCNIYPLVQINSPKLDKQVKKFIEAVKQESENEIHGGSTKKAPKVLADVVEAIAAAIYQDCNFNLDKMWEVVKRLLEPLITADTFKQPVITADTFKQPVTALYQLCQKKGKVVQFKPSREGKNTIFEVLIDGEKVGYGLAKHKYIAKLNAARDALKKLNGEKSNLSIKAHKEVEREKSTLRAPTILHSQHQLATRRPLPSISFSSSHEKIGTKEKKEYHSVELRPTQDERDKIEKVRKGTAAKQKLNELCMKRHWPPPEYQSETKEMSAGGEKGKGKGHMTDPLQHQHPKPALSPMLIASAQPGPGNKACSVSPKRKGKKKLMTAPTQFCLKKGKVVKFKSSRKGNSTTISEVLVDGEKVGYGSSNHKYIAKLNASRDALEKLNGEKSNLSIKAHKEVEYGEKSTLRASTIPHSQHQLAALGSLPSLSFSSPHEKIETKEKKKYYSVELKPTRDERDKIEEVRKEPAAKQKVNELCMKKHCPPPEYHEIEEMSSEGEKGKGEGQVEDPPQHQHPKQALSPMLTASAHPAPEESTKYEELEESTESNESQELEESTEYEEFEESEEDIPYMDKVDSYQRKTGYNVTVEGRERRERRLPWCGIDIGWLLFILGFFLCGIPWLIGAIMLCNSRVDSREKPGYISCTIAAVLALVVCIILDRQKELMIGDFRLL